MRLKACVSVAMLTLVGLTIGQSEAAEPKKPRAVTCKPIRNAAQLQAMKNDPSASYCLSKDIDASSIANFEPIGTFRGRLFGNGHVIRNLTILGSRNPTRAAAGLFSVIEGGTVQDVGLVNVRVVGRDGDFRVGGLAGQVNGSSAAPALISRVYVTGSVVCESDLSGCQIGGIIGAMYPAETTLEDSWSAADVSISADAGAVGMRIGGAIGTSEGTISRSFATGRVDSVGTGWIGGLAGASAGTVSQSFAAGVVNAGLIGSAGGLIGRAMGLGVKQSFALGPVIGGDGSDVSGLIAAAENSNNAIDQTYAAGRVENTANARQYGLIGRIMNGTPTVTNSFWDLNTTGRTTSVGGGTGLTTAQLQTLPAGFDTRAWSITNNRSYPFLDDPGIPLAASLATLVRNSKVFVVLPMSQLDVSQYLAPPSHADEASKAVAFTMIARAIGITNNVAELQNVKIDQFFWNDATQKATFTGPVTLHASLGQYTALQNKPLNGTNVVGQMNARRLVLLRGSFRKEDGTAGVHWMLGTLYIRNPDGSLGAIVAHDPQTGRQVMIDPVSRSVMSANFPLRNFKVNAYQSVTVN